MARNRLAALPAHCCAAKQTLLDYRAELGVNVAGVQNSLTSLPHLSSIFLAAKAQLGGGKPKNPAQKAVPAVSATGLVQMLLGLPRSLQGTCWHPEMLVICPNFYDASRGFRVPCAQLALTLWSEVLLSLQRETEAAQGSGGGGALRPERAFAAARGTPV